MTPNLAVGPIKALCNEVTFEPTVARAYRVLKGRGLSREEARRRIIFALTGAFE